MGRRTILRLAISASAIVLGLIVMTPLRLNIETWIQERGYDRLWEEDWSWAAPVLGDLPIYAFTLFLGAAVALWVDLLLRQRPSAPRKSQANLTEFQRALSVTFDLLIDPQPHRLTIFLLRLNWRNHKAEPLEWQLRTLRISGFGAYADYRGIVHANHNATYQTQVLFADSPDDFSVEIVVDYGRVGEAPTRRLHLKRMLTTRVGAGTLQFKDEFDRDEAIEAIVTNA